MKKFIIVFFILIIAIKPQDYKSLRISAKEIDNIFIVQALGIDKGDRDGEVKLIVTSKPAIIVGKSEPKEADIIIAQGKTIFAAIREMQKYTSKIPFWAHVDFIIFGEELAKEGINQYLDFFVREQQLRLHSRPLIVKGTSAEEFLRESNTKDIYISESLKQLFDGAGHTSVSSRVNLDEFIATQNLNQNTAYLPLVAIRNTDKAKERDKVKLSSFGIINNGKLTNYLNENQAMGLNILKNNFRSGIVVIKDETNSEISLEVIDAESKIKTEIRDDGNVQVFVEATIKSNIGEYEGNKDLFNPESVEELEKKQASYFYGKINNAIGVSLKNNEDFIGIKNCAFRQNPMKFKRMELDWERVYPKIRWHIKVKSTVLKSYLINEPVLSVGGKNE